MQRPSRARGGRSHFDKHFAASCACRPDAGGWETRVVAELFVLAVFPLLLAVAAGWDVASFTIPNTISAALLLAFVAYALATQMPLDAVGAHLLGGLVGLLIGFTLFAIGYVGGGDAKLFACTALWFGFSDLLLYGIFASLLGGALALVLMGARRLPLPPGLAHETWLVRLHDAKSGIPYGVALAAGALLVLPHTEIFRQALSQ
jgi:prepilin peptidase CpaA